MRALAWEFRIGQLNFFFNPIWDSHLKLVKPSFFWLISSPLPHHTPDPSTMFPEQPKPRSLPYSASSQLFPFQVFLKVLLTQCTFQNSIDPLNHWTLLMENAAVPRQIMTDRLLWLRRGREGAGAVALLVCAPSTGKSRLPPRLRSSSGQRADKVKRCYSCPIGLANTLIDNHYRYGQTIFWKKKL